MGFILSLSAAENDTLEGAGPEEILLDENAEAEQHKFYMTAAVEESPDQKLLAYAEDTKGGEKFTLRVIDIATREQLMAEPIKVGFAYEQRLPWLLLSSEPAMC